MKHITLYIAVALLLWGCNAASTNETTMENSGKMVIYQVFTRLYGNNNPTPQPDGTRQTNGVGKMADFTPSTLQAIKELGATHIWYTGVIAHATQSDYSGYDVATDNPAIVKGKAGSPYAIKDYYDIDPDIAVDVPHRMQEFEALVERSHAAGLKVIIDFVPNHVSRQYHSLAKPQGVEDLGQTDDKGVAFSAQNNFYYIPNTPLQGAAAPYEEFPARATGNDRFDAYPTADDWYETIKLNYGVDYQQGGSKHFDPIPNTWGKMRDILLFWAAKGVDGFRCDMAEMVPVEFWGWALGQLKAQYPTLVFVAEIYNPQAYRSYLMEGKFDYLYDKVGLYDTLRAVTCGNASANAITHCWQQVEGIQDKMLNFLENHDEQRLASRFFAGSGERGVPAMIVSACMNVNPVMIYFAQEYGEAAEGATGFSGDDGRTSIFDYTSVPTLLSARQGTLTPSAVALHDFYARLLHLCASEAAISRGSFFDLMYVNQGDKFNPHRQYAFLRKFGNELLVVVANFADTPADIALQIPQHAFDCLQLPQLNSVTATELLTNTTCQVWLQPDRPMALHVPALHGVVMKLAW